MNKKDKTSSVILEVNAIYCLIEYCIERIEENQDGGDYYKNMALVMIDRVRSLVGGM